MVTTSRKLFHFQTLDGGYRRKEPYFYLLPKMIKFYPKWLVDYFAMLTCAFTNPLQRLRQLQIQVQLLTALIVERNRKDKENN